MVTQVLVLAVQNSVERRDLGVATATTGFFRALGGAVGAAVLGAIFAARAGEAGAARRRRGRRGRVRRRRSDRRARASLAVLFLVELPLRGPGEQRRTGQGARSAPQTAIPTR